MDEYGPSTYGDRIADIYDERYAELPFGGELSATVAFLKDLAAEGPALELGIGTGRVAIPLVEAGVRVHGIDASDAMVAGLRAKPGGSAIDVTMGDFRDFSLEDRFRLVYVVFNTFFGLLSQDDQVSCFQAVSRHLSEDGVFVMEAFVPDVGRFDRGQRVSATRVELDEVELEVSKHDAIAQRTDSHHVVVREDGVRLYPVKVRYAHVAELDLMARLAGMRLRERWGDWDRSPLAPTSQKHVSVWQLDRQQQ
jgi:SAM-dependent methyltransferase